MASDTRSFCQPVLRYKPLLALWCMITTLAYLDILVKNPLAHPINLYDFRQSFRLQYGAQCLGGIVFYCILVVSFRQVVDLYTRQRVTSFWDFLV